MKLPRWGRRETKPQYLMPGLPLTPEDISAHLLVLGATGSGKSYSTRPLLAGLMRLGCPVVFTAAKPDEHRHVERMAYEAGAHSRYVRVRPGSGHSINLVRYLLGYKDPFSACEFLDRLNEVALRASGSHDEAFWAGLVRDTTVNSLRLCLLAGEEPCLADMLAIVRSSPASAAEAASDAFAAGEAGACSAFLRRAALRTDPAALHDLRECAAFWMNTYAAIGEKARAVPMAQLAGSLGRLCSGAFRPEFNTTTTLTPETVEARRLVVCLDFPVLEHGPSARLYQLAIVMLLQEYALRRDARAVRVPLVLVRDEAQLFLHPSWDMTVQTVARGQKLLQVSLTQDVNVLRAAIGGPRSREEALGFLANHATKLFFGCTDPETCEYASKVIGERIALRHSGGGGSQEAGDGTLADRALGVRRHGISWQESKEPWVWPGQISALPRGVAVLHSGGRSWHGRPFYACDFRR